MKSNQVLTILFWHRKSKADSKGLAPIICRISIDGSNEEFSVAHKVHVDDWDIDVKRVRKATNAKAINSTINHIQNILETHFTVLKTQYDSVSALMLKNAYKNLPIHHKKRKPETCYSKNTYPARID
jgi:asparagine synthetase A